MLSTIRALLARTLAVTILLALLIGPLSTYSAASAALPRTYPNLFRAIGITDTQVRNRLNAAFNRLFYGDASQRVYYPVGNNMAYIAQGSSVFSEGMSYGMMIAVQMNKKAEFDRLWTWTKRYMQHQSGPRAGYFAWHLDTNGTQLDPNSAPDGETYFATALFFAAGRWGNGTGIYNYQAEANAILDAMLNKERQNGGIVEGITNQFDRQTKLVVFAPVGDAARYTNPSYQTPAFYELWARWANRNNQFWREAAAASRRYFRTVAHETTGLTPDYSEFDGRPRLGDRGDFGYDAWRVAMNIAVDYAWFRSDQWQVSQSNRLLNFFHSQGIRRFKDEYTLDGRPLSPWHSPGLVAMNATAALAATTPKRLAFVRELWRTPIPSGEWRYYNGMLYLMGMLHVSGNFRVYAPGNTAAQQSIQVENDVPQLNYFTDNPITLTWNPVTWAAGYQLEVADNAEMLNPVYTVDTLGADEIDHLLPELPPQQWFWRVRARREDGTWGEWSSVETFTLGSG